MINQWSTVLSQKKKTSKKKKQPWLHHPKKKLVSWSFKISFKQLPAPRRSSWPFREDAFTACARTSATVPATAPVQTPPKRSMARDEEAEQKAASRRFLGVWHVMGQEKNENWKDQKKTQVFVWLFLRSFVVRSIFFCGDEFWCDGEKMVAFTTIGCGLCIKIGWSHDTLLLNCQNAPTSKSPSRQRHVAKELGQCLGWNGLGAWPNPPPWPTK